MGLVPSRDTLSCPVDKAILGKLAQVWGSARQGTEQPWDVPPGTSALGAPPVPNRGLGLAPCSGLQHLCGSTQGPELGLRMGTMAPRGFQASTIPRPGERGWQQAAELLGPVSSHPSECSRSLGLVCFQRGLALSEPQRCQPPLLHAGRPGPTLPPGWQPGAWRRGPPAQRGAQDWWRGP